MVSDAAASSEAVNGYVEVGVSAPGVALVEWEIVSLPVPEAVCGTACVPDAASLAVLESVAKTGYDVEAVSVPVPGMALIE